MDSKILDIVTRWAEPLEPSESAAESTAAETTEDESESLLTPPISTKSPVSILTSLRDSKPVKKKVKFADEASGSDSESRTSEVESAGDTDSVSSSSQSGKQFKKKSYELRKKLLDKDRIDIDLKEILKGEVTLSDEQDSQQEEASGSQEETTEATENGEAADVKKEEEKRGEEKAEEEKAGEDKRGEEKREKDGEEKMVTEGGAEDDVVKPKRVHSGDEVCSMAAELLSIWANLKVFFIDHGTHGKCSKINFKHLMAVAYQKGPVKQCRPRSECFFIGPDKELL